MSDKKNISIQDQGWNEMLSVLDKELPVEKKRRKSGIWFLFGSAVIGAFFITILFLMSESDKKAMNQKYSLIAEQLYSEKVISESQANSENKFESELTPSQKNEKDQFKNIKERNLNIKGQNKEDLKDISSPMNTNIDESLAHRKKTLIYDSNEVLRSKHQFSNSNSNSETEPVKTVFGNQKLQNNQLPDYKDKGLKISGEDNKDIEAIELPNKSVLERMLLAPLFRLPMDSLAHLSSQKPMAQLDGPLMFVNKRNSFSPYVLASSNYQANFNGLGYGGGVGLNYGNQNRQVYIEASYLKSNFSTRSSSQATPALDADAPAEAFEQEIINFADLNSPQYEIILNVTNVSKLTTSTDELKIGIGVRQKLLRKLRFDIGLDYSRLMKASNKSLNVDLNTITTSPEGVSYNVKSTELFDRGAYSSYDIVPHIGLEYEVSSNLFINLNANYGLKNLIVDTTNGGRLANSSNGDDEIYRRNVGLKLRYEF